MKKPFVLIAAIVAVVGLIAAPVPAAKDRKEVKTRVKITRVSSTIESADPTAPSAIYQVYGVVRSPREECRGKRPKELIHHPSDWHAAAGELRHFNLFWRERTLPFTEEHDRVKVRRSPSPDGRFICKADRSRRFTIPPPSEAAVAAVAKEKIKVETSVSLTASLSAPQPDPSPSFVGEVKAKKKGCERGRTVTVSNGSGYKVGPDKTNNRGKYRIFISGHDVPLHEPFTAKVRKMRLTKASGKTIVCKAAKSKQFMFD